MAWQFGHARQVWQDCRARRSPCPVCPDGPARPTWGAAIRSPDTSESKPVS